MYSIKKYEFSEYNYNPDTALLSSFCPPLPQRYNNNNKNPKKRSILGVVA